MCVCLPPLGGLEPDELKCSPLLGRTGSAKTLAAEPLLNCFAIALALAGAECSSMFENGSFQFAFL